MPLIAHSETYFKEGSKWSVQHIGTHAPGGVRTTETVYIEGEAVINGFNAMKMFVVNNNDESTRRLATYARTEGERVYFFDGQSQEWLLMYDFGLTVGEGCYVYSVPTGVSDSPNCSYVKCTARTESDKYAGWGTLILEEYESEACTNPLGQGEWLIGLASTSGVFGNNRFDVDGVCSMLLSASYRDEEICQMSQTGIEGLVCTPLTVNVCGMTLSVSNAGTKGMLSLYKADGTLVNRYELSGNDIDIRLPHKGVYILSTGSYSQKICAI